MSVNVRWSGQHGRYVIPVCRSREPRSWYSGQYNDRRRSRRHASDKVDSCWTASRLSSIAVSQTVIAILICRLCIMYEQWWTVCQGNWQSQGNCVLWLSLLTTFSVTYLMFSLKFSSLFQDLMFIAFLCMIHTLSAMSSMWQSVQNLVWSGELELMYIM